MHRGPVKEDEWERKRRGKKIDAGNMNQRKKKRERER
jgi:hypothetical protein